MSTIRRATPADRQAVLALAARAWQPVFESVNAVLGLELARALHGDDWQVHHAAEVAGILDTDTTVTWVAEIDGQIAGFAAARVVDRARKIGEIQILGVDPAVQQSGIGTALTRHAEDWLGSEQTNVACIGTGGDVGHEPARRLYEALGYSPFPVIKYYKVLRSHE